MKKLRKWLRKLFKTRVFHVCVVLLIIAAIVAFGYVKIKEYDVEGEKDMPFEVDKISVISSVSGTNVEGEQAGTARWNLNISQNNDFYIYIEKNENYNGRIQETIESVTIDNIEIEKNIDKGQDKIYRPDEKSEKDLFKNVPENEIDKVVYKGESESKVKSMQMSNQGDLIYFRYTNENIATYASNEEELNYNELFKKAGIKEEDLRVKVKFNMAIKLASGKVFRTVVSAEVPVEGIVEKGTTSGDIVDVNQLVFKRD